MKKILTVLLVAFSLQGFAQQKDLTWHTDVNKAINLSVQTGKPLFFFFTGSDWCGWCIKLQKEVFFLPEFKKWATKNVILVELDFPRRTPISDDLKKQNRELANMFGVRGYPSVWFVKGDKLNNSRLKIQTLSNEYRKIKGNKTKEAEIAKQIQSIINSTVFGSQGYVRGGPTAWIAGANKILKKN